MFHVKRPPYGAMKVRSRWPDRRRGKHAESNHSRPVGVDPNWPRSDPTILIEAAGIMCPDRAPGVVIGGFSAATRAGAASGMIADDNRRKKVDYTTPDASLLLSPGSRGARRAMINDA